MDEKKTFLHYLKYQKNYSVLTLESYDRELILKNAPEKEAGCVSVPQTVE